MKDTGKASLGQAVAHLIGEAIHHAVLSVLPHAHQESLRHRMQVWQELGDAAQTELAPLFSHILDTGKVHPLLEPTIRKVAGRPKEGEH
jgi:hypothetical protein